MKEYPFCSLEGLFEFIGDHLNYKITIFPYNEEEDIKVIINEE